MFRTKKRHILVLIALIALCALSLTLVACGGDKTQSGSNGDKIDVVYHINDSTDATHTEQALELTQIAKKFTPDQREGYDFEGWAFDAEGTKPFAISSVNSSTLDLYAIWKIKKFTVTFRIEETSSEIVRTVEYGGAAQLPTEEELRGLIPSDSTLLGWLDENDELMDENDADASFKHIRSKITFLAKLQKNSFTVNFYIGDELHDSKSGKTGEEISPSDDPIKAMPEKEGFNSEGWFTKDGEKLDFASGTPTFKKNENYYAKYSLKKPSTPYYDDSEFDPEFVSLAYGEELTIDLTTSAAPADITYVYEWTADGEKVGTGTSHLVPVQKLGAGRHNYSVTLTAQAEGCESVTSDALEFSFEISKTQLFCILPEIELTYGEALPRTNTVKITYEGFKYGESVEDVDVSRLIVKSDDYVAGNDAGTYTYYIEGFSADNYELVAKNGGALSSSVNVARKALSVAVNDISFSYGSVSETFSPAENQYTPTGLLLDHKLSLSLTINSDITPATYRVGEGNDVIANVTVSDKEMRDVTANYAITVSAKITIAMGTLQYKLPQETSFTYDGEEHSIGLNGVMDGCVPQYKVGEDGDYKPELPKFTDAGEYTVFFKLALANYESIENSFDVHVAKAIVQVTAKEQKTTYGYDFTLDPNAYTIDGIVPTGANFELHAACAYTPGDDAKNYEITIEHTENKNVELSIVKGRLVVAKADIEILPVDVGVKYGEALDVNKLFTINNKPEFGKEPKVSASTQYSPGTKAGSYLEITLKIESDPNYNAVIKGANGHVTVERRDITVKLNDIEVIFGDNVATEAYGYSLSAGEMFGEEKLELAYDTDYKQGDAVNGTYRVSAILKQAEVNENYNVIVERGSLKVNKRPVTVKVDDVSVTYGEALAQNFKYSLLDDTYFYGAAPAPSYSSTYAAGATSGEIKAEFVDQNHEITVQNGTINVLKRNISITLNGAHASNGAPYSHEFKENDSAVRNLFAGDKLSGTLSTKGSEEKTYNSFDMFEWTKALSITNSEQTEVTEYYQTTYILNISIKQDVILFVAEGWTGEYDGKEYGGTVTIEDQSLQNTSITYSTQKDGDYSNVMPKFKYAGEYTVFFKINATGKTETTGEFTVNIAKRRATITATSLHVTYGDEAPQYKYEAQNVLDDDKAALNMSATSAYKQNDDVKAGGYEITINFTVNKNYEITVVSGTLTVDPKAVDVELSGAAEVTYGEAFAYNGKYTFDAEGLEDTLTFGTEYRVGNGVKPDGEGYAITAKGSDNYAYTVTNKLIVKPRKATITLNATTVTYGASIETALKNNTTFTGLYGSDRIDVTYEGYATGANESGYDVTVSATDGNYEFTTTGGKLIVRKANLTLKLSGSSSVTYGDALPSLSISGADGLVGGDTDWNKVVSGDLTLTSDYDITSPEKRKVGTYSVTGSGYTSDNYNISYSAFILTVNPATLTFTANAISGDIHYKDAFPTQLSFTVSGFEYDDNAESLALPVMLASTTSYKAGVTNAGTSCTYNVTLTDELALENYNVKAGASLRFTLQKANHTGITHSAITSQTYSPELTLNSIKLNAYFRWKTPSTKPTCDVTSYDAIYNNDATNYSDFELKITVRLQKAKSIISATKPAPEFNWTGNAVDLQTVFGTVTSTNKEVSTVTFDDSNPKTGTDGGVYAIKYTTPETTNYAAASQIFYVKIKAAVLGGTYYTVEDALSAAKSGDTVTLKGNAFISQNVNIPSGVTLNMPYDGTNLTGDGVVGASGNNAQGFYIDVLNTTTYQRLLLTVRTGVTLKVLGILNIGGITGIDNGGYFQGATCSYYARVHLEGTASIVVDGTIDLHGFITSSDSSATLILNSSAKLKAPFVVRDYRGGSSTGGAYNEGKISPFNQYEMPNIQNITQTIHSGATVTAYVSLRTEKVDMKLFTIDPSYNKSETTLLAKSNALINLTSGSMNMAYTPSVGNAFTNKTTITLNASSAASIGSLSMKIEVAGSLLTVKVNTKDVYFPIPYNYDITVKDEATLSIPNTVKMLSGSRLCVESGGTLDLTGGGLVVYDGNWTDSWNTTKDQRVYPADKGAAQLIINGTFNIKAPFGGMITGGKGGKVVVTSSTLSITTKEGFGTRDGFTFYFTQTYSHTYAASLNGYSSALSTGTYTCNGSTWTNG